ncbi:ABC transporter ATP-binding protein [Motilibacter deserti]|uniref:ABC transporter ATP-binding protein n=1 Tax=Motilibacter deserti TaxID=2714956 RepID=A0ABX0GWB4_9ACTN|nr:ABC transporter ATP-binding protein [Motilibacter deserti]NHC13925.1 ABC transporter ATP-binding protein [Motilibacter deserti]
MTLIDAVGTPAGPAGTTPVVSVRGVRKAFGRGEGAVFALDRVSLDVAPGEFVALLGASGCGKSTLLSLIAGLDRPTAGEVAVAGDGAALMPQEGGLFPWLTAGRNVELALRLRGVSRSDRRTEAERLLSLVRLDGAYDKRPHELSGGMRQRVALARALAQKRPVLLMDEPFSALDAITRDALHGELIRIWEETGVAIVFVTHNVREAVRLGQRVVLLSSRPGRVIREWQVDIAQPRRIEAPDVSALAGEITERLSTEIRRHATAEAAAEQKGSIDVRQ